jgi:hypothetical protein
MFESLLAKNLREIESSPTPPVTTASTVIFGFSFSHAGERTPAGR